MLNRLINILMILSVSLIGADRINILTDSFDFFVFTPFLLFSSLLFFILIIYKNDMLDLRWFMSNNNLVLFFSIYIITCIISIFFSIDIYISIKRFILLIYLILTSLIFLSYYNNKNELKRLLVYSSIIGSFVFYGFNLILIINWFTNFDIDISIINFIPDQIAYFIPRLGGYTMDSNRGNVILCFFSLILFLFNKKSKINSIIIIINICFLLLSFSRTIYLLVFIIMIYQLFITKKIERKNILKNVFYGVFFFIIIISYLDMKEYIDLELTLRERFDFFEISRFSSAGIHLRLIKEGFYTAFSDFKILFFGSGFGTSFILIKGYYWSGVKYGNYHSLYITSLVESGVINCISIFVISFLLPLILDYKNSIVTFLFGLLFFNIFYQLIMEPLFWFSILLFYKFYYFDFIDEK
tara:strand:+ start:1081 stop:2316 length:1236 start_codon:yes stop_codon:yes gene_type:complete